MKKIKKFLPFFIFLSFLIAGIILFFVYKNLSIFTKEKFLSISLTFVGFIGFITTSFLVISQKKNERIIGEKNQENQLQKQIYQLTEEIKRQTETKKRKIVCYYCKHKYDEDLNRCPNCGAPPNN